MKITQLQNDFSWGQISEKLYARIDLPTYSKGVKTLQNAYPFQQGGIRRRPGTLSVAQFVPRAHSGVIQDVVRVLPFVIDQGVAAVCIFTNKDDGGGEITFIENGEPLVVSYDVLGYHWENFYIKGHVYSNEELKDIRWCQLGKSLVITHPNHPPQRLSRLGDLSWELVPMECGQQVISDIKAEYRGIVMEVVNGTIPFRVGDKWEFNIDEFGVVTNDVDASNEPIATVIDPDGVAANNDPTHEDYSDLVAPANGALFITKMTNGAPIIAQSITLTCTRLSGGRSYFAIDGSVSGTPHGGVGSDTPFDWDDGNYPAATAWHQQRLWYAGTPRDPTRIWASSIDKFFDLTVGVLDSDGLSFQISSDSYDGITHLSTGRVMLIHSYSNEFSVVGGNNQAIGASNILVQPQTSHGSSGAKPVRVGNEVMYVQRDGLKLRSTSYSVAQDAYTAADFSVTADDICEKGLKYMAFAQDPDFVLWTVTDTGELLSTTINPNRDVVETTVGWSVHSTNGEYEDVAVLNRRTGSEVWLAVRRQFANGEDYISIEKMSYDSRVQTDGGVLLEGTGTEFEVPSAFDGLELTCVIDGMLSTNITPSDGTITLPTAATQYVQIGYNFTSKVELLHPEVGNVTQNLQGDKVTVHEARIRFKDTLTSKFRHQSTSDYDEIPFMTNAVIADEAIPLFSGDKKIHLTGWQNPYHLEIIQDRPFPWTILGVILKIAVNPNG